MEKRLSPTFAFHHPLSIFLLSLCSLCPLWLNSISRAADISTPHYLIHTELEPRLSEDLANRMELMYAQYSARWANFLPSEDKRFEVYLYRRRADYLRLTGQDLRNTGGIFIPSRNLLAAFLEEQGRDSLRRTLQHEAFHQFALRAIGPKLPVWLNEGIAQIFEEGLWVGNEFRIEQVPPRRIRQLQQDMRDRRLMPFRQFLTMSDAEWNKGLRDATIGAARYSQAWAMAHFLIFARGEDGETPKYRARLTTMLKLIHDGNQPGDAFIAAFSDNIDGFQQMFLSYARSLQSTQEVVFVERQNVLADLLIVLEKEGKHVEDIDAFHNALTKAGYRLSYTKGNVKWSTEADPNFYFRDALGRMMSHEQLFLSIRPGAPLPDIVCRPIDGLQFHTVFHDAKDRPDHETIIEKR